ncbi:MAG: type II toxin-antitoxin system death-on-curing family toxin [Deltaproteobacteria bacterium]
MKKLLIPTPEQVVLVNKVICEKSGSPHLCRDLGKIESALHTTFFPGIYPFSAGGIAKTAGALCFYLVKSHAFLDGNKRTGALVAITFMEQNGWTLKYPIDKKQNFNALAEIIEDCAASNITKEVLVDWFDAHKQKLR